jgi:hypothetical protein
MTDDVIDHVIGMGGEPLLAEVEHIAQSVKGSDFLCYLRPP